MCATVPEVSPGEVSALVPAAGYGGSLALRLAGQVVEVGQAVRRPGRQGDRLQGGLQHLPANTRQYRVRGQGKCEEVVCQGAVVFPLDL